MLSNIRNWLDNWIVRGLFFALILVFVFWGISNVVTLIGANDSVAAVAGISISAPSVQQSYQQSLTSYEAQNNGAQPSPAIRSQLANQALGQAIDHLAMAREVAHLGVAAPPDALRAQVYAMQVFQGTGGVFDKTVFAQVLQQNGLTPNSFMAEARDSMNAQQVVDAISAGEQAPTPLVMQIFNYVGQQRQAQLVHLPFAAVSPPPLPATPVLERYWTNHPELFSSPPMRDAQIVILSPALLAKDETVTPAALQEAYAQHADQYTTIAKRSVEIITAPDTASAASLQSAWANGADWAAMKAAAAKVNATGVTFDHATEAQFPSPVLAKAVFAATPGQVSGPVQSPLGTYIFKVTDAVAGGVQPLAAVAPQLKQQLALSEAHAQVDKRVNELQDDLAANTSLDKLPGNLGLVAVQGSMDAQGMTIDGTPAPIPGGADLRAAVIKAVFAAHKGDQPSLINGPDGSYFAVSVTKEMPAAVRPFAQVSAQVGKAWIAEQTERTQEAAAAGLLAAVKSGKTLDEAANAAGLSIEMSPPISRIDQSPVVPANLVPILFSMKKGHATMVQTPDGFVVAVLTSITPPDPTADQAVVQRIAAALSRNMKNDVVDSFANALRVRDHVTVNQKMLAQVTN
jgi:peptidyl-prolyl cis-trans isomerase D